MEQTSLSSTSATMAQTSLSSNENSLVAVLGKAANNTRLTESMIRFFREQGYPQGLMNTFMEAKKKCALRIWIIDNSGSMTFPDGVRIIKDDGLFRIVDGCTRWAEMQQTVECHARIAAAIEAPTVFKLLNDPGAFVGPQEMTIAINRMDRSSINEDLQSTLTSISNAVPAGVTQITHHIWDIRATIQTIESYLRSTGTKVCLVIATDGVPSDSQGHSPETIKRDFVAALRGLEDLPVWLVVRLFTSNSEVVNFWNEIDKNLELSIEVLDDYKSEAKEIQKANSWLTYGLPLHRLREFGYSHYLFDGIDEFTMTKSEIRSFTKMLLGHGLLDESPDPDAKWKEFLKILGEVNSDPAIQKQFNPIKRKMTPWINMKAAYTLYPTETESNCTIS